MDVFEQGCTHFDNAQYFEAHEFWEELWMESVGPRHAYLQGLIQVSVALHHATNENWNGTRKLFSSALGYLERGVSEAVEVDTVKLKDLVLDFELALQEKLAGQSVELPFFKLPRK